MSGAIQEAIGKLSSGPLSEEAIQRHIAPLFSRTLASSHNYLANHSLGRPLDQLSEDLRECITLWQTKLGHAWDAWIAEREAFRERIARLVGASRVDCVVPKTSAGQGLRTVLNMVEGKARVLSTRGEFDSIDLILKQYAALGRIEVQWVEPELDGRYTVAHVLRDLRPGIQLVVISQVMFMDGQIVHDLPLLANACHALGARLMVDAYHAVGVIPVNVTSMQADFVIGGSYKYLRGGPGACFLYVSPEALASGLRPVDTGWFARQNIFGYERSDPPLLSTGGDAFLESTPPVLTYYQARSGQIFTLAMGVERLRLYGLEQLARLKNYLCSAGIEAVGGDGDHGAFLAVRLDDAVGVSKKLTQRGVVTDARGPWLRLCPDCLTQDKELRMAASALRDVLEGAHS